MLFQKDSMKGNRPRANAHHLLECISSATSIITIYDLFCQSFGFEYTVLSLSYGIYTAASIFLLQIQAASRPDAQALPRLRFCISALEQLSVSNPGLATIIFIYGNFINSPCSCWERTGSYNRLIVKNKTGYTPRCIHERRRQNCECHITSGNSKRISLRRIQSYRSPDRVFGLPRASHLWFRPRRIYYIRWDPGSIPISHPHRCGVWN